MIAESFSICCWLFGAFSSPVSVIWRYLTIIWLVGTSACWMEFGEATAVSPPIHKTDQLYQTAVASNSNSILARIRMEKCRLVCLIVLHKIQGSAPVSWRALTQESFSSPQSWFLTTRCQCNHQDRHIFALFAGVELLFKAIPTFTGVAHQEPIINT